jgi:hypothetical protein
VVKPLNCYFIFIKSYGPKRMIRDLNTKPFACKANALPIELIIQGYLPSAVKSKILTKGCHVWSSLVEDWCPPSGALLATV